MFTSIISLLVWWKTSSHLWRLSKSWHHISLPMHQKCFVKLVSRGQFACGVFWQLTDDCLPHKLSYKTPFIFFPGYRLLDDCSFATTVSNDCRILITCLVSGSSKRKQFKTAHKYPLLYSTKAKLSQMLKQEYDFFYFVTQRFYSLLVHLRTVKHLWSGQCALSPNEIGQRQKRLCAEADLTMPDWKMSDPMKVPGSLTLSGGEQLAPWSSEENQTAT